MAQKKGISKPGLAALIAVGVIALIPQIALTLRLSSIGDVVIGTLFLTVILGAVIVPMYWYMPRRMAQVRAFVDEQHTLDPRVRIASAQVTEDCVYALRRERKAGRNRSVAEDSVNDKVSQYRGFGAIVVGLPDSLEIYKVSPLFKLDPRLLIRIPWANCYALEERVLSTTIVRSDEGIVVERDGVAIELVVTETTARRRIIDPRPFLAELKALREAAGPVRARLTPPASHLG